MNCTALEKVYFESNAKNVSSMTFNGCTAITDIYVPWAEGTVSGAPWGATNATIHYETTYDSDGNPV